MKPVLGSSELTQVGIVVENIEKTKHKWAAFLGMDAPDTIDLAADPNITQTQFNGEPTPNASCKIAVFRFGSVQMDLIEPNDAPSSWRDFLEQKGEGIHHIAFNVSNTQQKLDAVAELGIGVRHRAIYGDGSGEYVYLDSQAALGCIVETMESYEK